MILSKFLFHFPPLPTPTEPCQLGSKWLNNCTTPQRFKVSCFDLNRVRCVGWRERILTLGLLFIGCPFKPVSEQLVLLDHLHSIRPAGKTQQMSILRRSVSSYHSRLTQPLSYHFLFSYTFFYVFATGRCPYLNNRLLLL